MRLDKWLQASTATLAAANVPSARLDCLILLEDVTGQDRSWLLAHPEYGIDQKTVNSLEALLKRRAKHEPLAYIRNQTEFYGRTFYVDKHVLEPRPESETMIELLKKLKLPKDPIIVDVGTGSGALAITAQLELPQAEVHAIDIDPNCLQVAERNATNHLTPITLHNSDLLEDFVEPADVLLANLPYVPDDFTINLAATNEPRLAIFGGPDGLDLYRRMFKQIDSLSHKPAYILAESLPPQHHALSEIAAASGYKQSQEEDFIQLLVR